MKTRWISSAKGIGKGREWNAHLRQFALVEDDGSTDDSEPLLVGLRLDEETRQHGRGSWMEKGRKGKVVGGGWVEEDETGAGLPISSLFRS